MFEVEMHTEDSRRHTGKFVPFKRVNDQNSITRFTIPWSTESLSKT